MSAGEKRLDQLLVERGLAETRARAQALVMAGEVWSGDKRLDKAGARMADDVLLEVKRRDHPYVSRGGLKLDHGLTYFRFDPKDKIALDIGASTGGFTDVLLLRSAKKVYAVDVGHGQLAWKLRQDSRVVVLERMNARYLTKTEIAEPPELIVCDASFIGLEVVLPAALALAAPKAELVALIKPQFEVGRGRVGRGGVVRDPVLHEEVCVRVSAWLGQQPGWRVLGVTESPIRGPDGNIEFLIGARHSA